MKKNKGSVQKHFNRTKDVHMLR